MKQLLIALFFVGILSAQQNNFLKDYYVGAFYTGIINANNEYYDWQNNISLLTAARLKFSVLSGSVNTRLMYGFNNLGAHLWYEKSVSFMDFSLGFFPRPIAQIHKPNPISWEGQYESESRRVIPGPALGMVVRFNIYDLNNFMMLGIFQTAEKNYELNFGFRQNINFGLFKSFSISGYKNLNNNDFQGIALEISLIKGSVMYYSGKKMKDNIKSIAARMDIFTNSEIFLNTVYKNNQWQSLEIGTGTFFKEHTFLCNIHYMLALAYVYSDVKPNTVNCYIQVWFGD